MIKMKMEMEKVRKKIKIGLEIMIRFDKLNMEKIECTNKMKE